MPPSPPPPSPPPSVPPPPAAPAHQRHHLAAAALQPLPGLGVRWLNGATGLGAARCASARLLALPGPGCRHVPLVAKHRRRGRCTDLRRAHTQAQINADIDSTFKRDSHGTLAAHRILAAPRQLSSPPSSLQQGDLVELTNSSRTGQQRMFFARRAPACHPAGHRALRRPAGTPPPVRHRHPGRRTRHRRRNQWTRCLAVRAVVHLQRGHPADAAAAATSAAASSSGTARAATPRASVPSPGRTC